MKRKKLIKKISIIAVLLITSVLFYNGISDFLFPETAKNHLIIENNKNTKQTADKNEQRTTGQKMRAGILQNISDTLKKPFAGSNVASIEINTANSIKNSLENYFTASSKIEFPDPQLVSDAITLHKRGENEAIKLLIEVLRGKNKELYAIIPPLETETIHNNSLWISGKFIEVLEKVLKTEDEQEILKILNSPETLEMRQITENAKQEIGSLIKKYELETKI